MLPSVQKFTFAIMKNINISINLELSPNPRKDGRHFIMLRISRGRSEKSRVSTRIYVSKLNFNAKARFGKWIRISCSNHAKLNSILKQKVQYAEEAIFELEKLKIEPTVTNVCDYLKGKFDNHNKPLSFTEYFKKVIDLLYKSQQARTFQRYEVVYNHLVKFCKSIPLQFKDFTVGFLHEYEAELRSKGLATNTVGKELSILRSVLYRGIDEGYFLQEKNPYFHFKIKYEKTHKERLTLEQVKKIEALDLKENTFIWHCRNFWCFSLYNGGVRFGDLCQLTWDNLKGEHLEYQMNKTSLTKKFKILKQAQQILSFYSDGNKEGYVFPLLKPEAKDYDEFQLVKKISSRNSQCNMYLKEIAKLADIPIRLSFHMSRHSFASILKDRGVDVYDISKALGHSSLKVTEVYLSSLSSSNEESFENIFND